MDDLYKRADILYSDKNEKIIFLFDSFIKKIREKNFSSVRNKDLDSLRIVHEHLESVDFSMRKEIDVATQISGNYYQHRHELFMCWRDMNRSHSRLAKLICMLACGELDMHNGVYVAEVAKDVYVGTGIGPELQAMVDKEAVFEPVADVWRLLMGNAAKSVRNVCFGSTQLRLPFAETADSADDVVAYYSTFDTCDLDPGKAKEILESWCDGEDSLVNMCLLTTQPLYSDTMKEDGLIGSFVARENMGKSLYTSMLSKCYRKVGNFSYKPLSDKGYLYQDLMANIVVNAKDFAVFQETDGITSNDMTALKPLVTYTDKVPARFFSGKTFESAYHGSVVLTSNYVNKLEVTGDVAKRMMNIRLRYSSLVRENVRWLESEEGATSVLLACLLLRKDLMDGEYDTAEHLKRNVEVSISDSVEDTSRALMLKSFFDEKGYVTGKEFGQIFDNPRGRAMDAIIRNYGLMRSRKGQGVVYRPCPDSDTFGDIVAKAMSGGELAPFALVKYSLTGTRNVFCTFDPSFPSDLVMELDGTSYASWQKDVELFKKAENLHHIVSETANELDKRKAETFNKMVVDYDDLPSDMTFEQLRDNLEATLGGVWFGLWESARSRFGALRVKLMVMLSKPLPVEAWGAAVTELDKIVGAAHDANCSPVHKQMLPLPWMKFFFNAKNVGWLPSVDGEACEETAERESDGNVQTPAPADFQAFKERFAEHVEAMSDQIDDYGFWMRTYLMPLARYVVYDKSLTFEEASELITMTTEDFAEQMSNVSLLKDAVRRRAGIDLYEQYGVSVEEFYETDGCDRSSDGFWFPQTKDDPL